MTKEEDFNHFMECMKEAGARMDPHYFQIEVAGSSEQIFRERVYCYELYNQLRNVVGDDFPYKLDGEVDKRGHPIIRRGIPDFIVHQPGNMRANLVVIEVKPLTVKERLGLLRDDINKLGRFLSEAQYYRAIMLIYGDGQHELPTEIISEVRTSIRDNRDRLLLMWHRGAGERPVLYNITNAIP